MKFNDTYMKIALNEARQGMAKGEVPVGAIIVHDGQVIALAHNASEATGDPRKHAEMLAIDRALEWLASNPQIGAASKEADQAKSHSSMWYAPPEVQHSKKQRFLSHCAMYVTLEPCPMCKHAIAMIRVGALYFGAYRNQHKEGSGEQHVETYGGVMEQECSHLLVESFQKLRNR